METIETYIAQVRIVLNEFAKEPAKHEVYNRFINECKALNLSETDFYKKILKPASKGIIYGPVLPGKGIDEEEEEEIRLTSAPVFIDRLVAVAFEDGIVEAIELKKIFRKAEENGLNSNDLVLKINKLLEDNNFKSFPKASLDAPTLKATLISTNWYNEFQLKIHLSANRPKRKKLFLFWMLPLLIVLTLAGFYFGLIYFNDNISPPVLLDRIFVEDVRATGFLSDKKRGNYLFTNMIDDNLDSWWTPFPIRSGIGAGITMYFKGNPEISIIKIHPGSHTLNFEGKGPVFPMNNRIQSGILIFSDGTMHKFYLKDKDEVQEIKFSTRKSNFIKVEIQTVFRGSVWQDLGISQFWVYGKRDPKPVPVVKSEPLIAAEKWVDALGKRDFQEAFQIDQTNQKGDFSQYSTGRFYGGVLGTYIFESKLEKLEGIKAEIFMDYGTHDQSNKYIRRTRRFYMEMRYGKWVITRFMKMGSKNL